MFYEGEVGLKLFKYYREWYDGLWLFLVLYIAGREVLNVTRVEGKKFALCTSLLVLCWILFVCLFFDHLNIWSDSLCYLGVGIWFQLGLSPTHLTYRLRHPGLHGALHTKTGLARHPVMGKYHLEHYELSGLCSLLGCPGPGSSYGNLAALPASKDAVSPSP